MGDYQYSPDLKQDLDRDGFVVLRGFLSPGEVADLWREIERYKREVVPNLAPTEHFYEVKGQPDTLKYLKSLSNHDAYFKDLFDSQKFVALARLLLDGEVTQENISLFNKPPRIGEDTPAHQDGFYFKLEPMEAITMWLALDEVDEANGCVRYVRGSHRLGMRPHNTTKTFGFSQGITDYGTPKDLQDEVPVTAQPGDLLIHHCMTVHRADPNTSDRTRHALGLVYYAARAQMDVAALKAYEASLQQQLVDSGKI